MPRPSRLFVVALFALMIPAAAAQAQSYDTPALQVVESAPAFIAVEVTAGASGAPGGFNIDWMKKSDYDALGGWPSDIYAPGFAYCTFSGVATLNTTAGVSSFGLAPLQSVKVVLGELFDETGVSTNYLDEMTDATQYVVRVRAEGDLGATESPNSLTQVVTSTASNNCTYTQGYWKNHPEKWPVSALTLTLGTITYSQADLLTILGTPAAGNGLVSLAHQLIATKLNIAFGATSAPIQSSVNAADALIGNKVVPTIGGGFLSPSSTSSLINTLDHYNNGLLGPPHCDVVSTRASSWGNLKVLYH